MSAQEARKVFRLIQNKYGHLITPERSIRIGQIWNEKLNQDTTGTEALKFVEHLYRELTLEQLAGEK